MYGGAPNPTPAPDEQLWRRATSDPGTIYYAPDNTCGFVDGVSSNSYGCDSGSTCVIYTSRSGVPGHVMCQGDNKFVLQTTCINSADKCEGDCAINTATLKCTNANAQFCNTIALPEDVTGYLCSSNRNTIPFKAQLTFSGQTGRSLSASALGHPAKGQPTATSSSSASSSTLPVYSAGTSTATSTPDQATTSSSSTPSQAASTQSSESSSGGGGSHTGAIVGGVVGGVAAVALVAVAIFLFLRRKKRKYPKSSHELPANSQQTPMQKIETFQDSEQLSQQPHQQHPAELPAHPIHEAPT